MLVWVRQEGEKSQIEAAWRSAGGVFGAATTLSPPNLQATEPSVGMDPRGDAVVSWATTGGYRYNIEAAWCSPGGAFNMPPAVLTSLTNFVTDPYVAMDAKGDAMVAWRYDNGGFDETSVASRPAGGSFGQVEDLSTFSFGSVGKPAIAMNSRGDATVAWSQNEIVKKIYLLQMATRTAGGPFNPATGIVVDATNPAVAIDGQGDSTVVWSGSIVEPATDTVEVSTRSRGEEFTSPLTLFNVPPPSLEGSYLMEPKVAMDAAGDTTVAWASPEGIRVATRSAGGVFEKPTKLLTNPLVTESSPAVSMDEEGSRTIVWVQDGFNDFETSLLGSATTLGEPLDEPLFISQEGYVFTPERTAPLSLAMDSHGDAVTSWVSHYNEQDYIQVAGYQAGAPSLESLQEPSEGQVGVPLEFSVSPASAWSEVTSTTWSWGDGSADSLGATAGHVYSEPGVYTVAVDATDALGNVASTTRTVTIRSATSGMTGETSTKGPKISSTAKSHPEASVPETVSAFTPYFATRASTGNNTIGLLEEVAEMQGAQAGDTLVVRCSTSCERPLHKVTKVKARKPRGKLLILPPFPLRQSTRIEIELLAKGRVTRFVEYRFARVGNKLVAHVVRRGCLTAKARIETCP